MHVRFLAAIAAALLAGCIGTTRPDAVQDGARAELTILETTDMHANVLGFDYYRLAPDPSIGFDRVATLIERARRQFPNTLLFDAGDTIQGTVLADYQARVAPLACDEKLAIYKAMDALGYDGATVGNHEFNYGLPFLAQVTGTPFNAQGVAPRRCKGPGFPIVLANVFSTRDGAPLYAPWAVIERRIHAHDARGEPIEAPLRIGLIGFTPPPIMEWDRANLEGRVEVLGILEAAHKYLPELRAQKPDLIIAIIHGGLSSAPYRADLDNAAWYLAGEPGIDALLLGHSHQSFPGPTYARMPQVDAERGTVRGVPAVMANFFARELGLVHLELTRRDGRWVSDAARAQSELWPICADNNHCVEPDPRIAPLVAQAHEAAIRYVETPIGRVDFHMSSYFADLGDMSALGVVNAAQKDYVERWIAENRPDLASIPVLSAAAAFRTGFGGAGDYTDVETGTLSIRSAADLYYYPNTLAAVEIDGATLKAWLETSAGRFNRIDSARKGPQPLIDTRFKGYNFDQIQGGIRYVIDITRPRGERITTLEYKGRKIAPDDRFIVATNNYRASGGGHFPGLDGSHTLLLAPDGNREILIEWLRRHPELRRADLERRSWHFAPLDRSTTLTYTSASNKADLARAAGIRATEMESMGNGMSRYEITLAAPAGAAPLTP